MQLKVAALDLDSDAVCAEMDKGAGPVGAWLAVLKNSAKIALDVAMQLDVAQKRNVPVRLVREAVEREIMQAEAARQVAEMLGVPVQEASVELARLLLREQQVKRAAELLGVPVLDVAQRLEVLLAESTAQQEAMLKTNQALRARVHELEGGLAAKVAQLRAQGGGGA